MRMIDRDALIGPIKLLEESYRRCGAIERAEAYANCLWEIEQAPTVNGWISVKDGLPDKNGQYLCWFGKNTVTKGAAIATYFEMWKAFGSLESLVTYPNVTHWMPIEPPEEESDGNRK